ncbi:MAG: very short patch repair endonuclease [Candidatus Shapirobacteria bacterium]|jgi:DNA mismatch endonuclease (patch repair protein)
MDNLIKEQRSLNMSRIKSSNTKLEQKFFKLLNERHIDYIDHPNLFGKPDCQINNVLIFIDSDFWHGWNFKRWKERLPKEYWRLKIARNINRDHHKFRKLKDEGYVVIRIWEHNLKKEDKMNKLLHNITQNNKG